MFIKYFLKLYIFIYSINEIGPQQAFPPQGKGKVLLCICSSLGATITFKKTHTHTHTSIASHKSTYVKYENLRCIFHQRYVLIGELGEYYRLRSEDTQIRGHLLGRHLMSCIISSFGDFVVENSKVARVHIRCL